MRWFKLGKLMRVSEWGHGDTLDGQKMAREMRRVTNVVSKLRESASDGGPWGVMGRWRGELRRRILMLPPVRRIKRMSMMELGEVSDEVDEIMGVIRKYHKREAE